MITQNFIKQCEQAEELQKWYKSDVRNVREGDRYICKCDTCKNSMYVHMVKDSDIDYINERDMTDVDPTYVAMVSLSGVGEFGAFWDDGGFIYLPTQEQLQEMVLTKNILENTWSLGWLINNIYRFSENKYEYEELPKHYAFKNFTETTELWLAFVMYKKWNKIWTGEKWVKAND